jgi:hypothetical protein
LKQIRPKICGMSRDVFGETNYAEVP